MNTIFLDIDGVLCTFRSLWLGWANAMHVELEETDFSEFSSDVNGLNPLKMDEIDKAVKSKKYEYPNLSMYGWPFDNICVNYLNQIIKDNNADIVVISTWRIGKTIQELNDLFKSKGIIGKVIGKTGYAETRGLEIVKWLDAARSKYDIEHICIIDDESHFDVSYLFEEYCLSDIAINTLGIKEKHIEEAKIIFNKPLNINQILEKSNKIINHEDYKNFNYLKS